MPTEETKNPQLSLSDKNILLNELINLADQSYKRNAVDSYSIQIGVVKNYFWLSFIMLSAIGVCFFEFKINQLLFTFRETNGAHVLSCFFLLMSFICSISTFWGALKASTGKVYSESGCDFSQAFGFRDDRSDEKNVYKKIAEQNLRLKDVINSKEALLLTYELSINSAIEQINNRAKILRTLSLRIKLSTVYGLCFLLFHFIGEYCL